jgi:uncharacterized protein YaiL (DUF2058 family)
MSTLKDQLLKAGLVKKNDVKKAPKKKAPTPAKKNRNKLSEQTLRTQRAMLDKAKKDKRLNQQRKLEAERKALAAQIKQLVDSSKLDRSDGEAAYNFTYKKKIKTIYVTPDQQKQLSRDQVVIVCLQGAIFEIVPKKAAEKIAERDPNSVIKNKVVESRSDADDPYADYQIPDDLVW